MLDERAPGHGVSADDVRPFLREGFPWHDHHLPHPELSASADAWWSALEPLLARAYERVGVVDPAGCARAVRARYTAHGWRLFDDTVPVLTSLRAQGWTHIVLSNHVPELGEIIARLGLDELLERVITSAVTGYEKPHPEAFRGALAACGNPETVWMLGDSPVADVAGAEALGIPAILVRGPDGCDLQEAADLLQRS